MCSLLAAAVSCHGKQSSASRVVAMCINGGSLFKQQSSIELLNAAVLVEGLIVRGSIVCRAD